jgi:hypothetical protein
MLYSVQESVNRNTLPPCSPLLGDEILASVIRGKYMNEEVREEKMGNKKEKPEKIEGYLN